MHHMATNYLEALPYGYFENIEQLSREVWKRIITGQTLFGEATIFKGARIIRKADKEYLEFPDGDCQRIEARVYANGNYNLFYTSKTDFEGELPAGWAEITNP